MKIPTLINSSSKINGELMFSTDVRIDGEVFGKVESDKNVIVGAEGYVKGFLRAKDLVVFGRIEGNIIVSGTTVLHASASVFGNLYTKVFEVQDGATITARVVTTDKLAAIDEAQIYLAEEMIKLEPNRRQIPGYVHSNINIEDTLDFTLEDESADSFLSDSTFGEQISASSGDVLSKIMEHNNLSKEEIQRTSSPSEILKEPVSIDYLNEMEEIVTADLCNNEHEIFTLLTSPDELLEIQKDNIPVVAVAIDTSSSVPGQNSLLEFDFEEASVKSWDLTLFPLPSPVSIADCLGEPIKEDSSKIRKGKKKTHSDATLISQATRKGKGHSLSGFEELRNLLIPVKYQDLKSVGKSDQEKYNPVKVSDNDLVNKSKGPEKGEFFLNNAIRQLPVDDYSSLFN